MGPPLVDHLQGCRGSGMVRGEGWELVLQVGEDDALEDKRRQGEMRRVLQPYQRAEDRKSGRGSAGSLEQPLAESSTGLG